MSLGAIAEVKFKTADMLADKMRNDFAHEVVHAMLRERIKANGRKG